TTTTTTTTTAPPTTTTTVAPGEPATMEVRDYSGWYSGVGYTAYTRLRFKDAGGKNLKKATVTVTFTLQDGSTATVSGKTDKKGKVWFYWGGLDPSDFPVTVTVDSVVKDGTTYSPTPSSATLNL
ncbi:MAG: hypothetical protein D6683_11050, partial [Actinomyces sp.]